MSVVLIRPSAQSARSEPPRSKCPRRVGICLRDTLEKAGATEGKSTPLPPVTHSTDVPGYL